MATEGIMVAAITVGIMAGTTVAITAAGIIMAAIMGITATIMVAVIMRIAAVDITTRMRAAFGMGVGTPTAWDLAGGGRTIMTNMFGSVTEPGRQSDPD